MELKKNKKTKVTFNAKKDGSKKNLVLMGGIATAVIFCSILLFNLLSSLFSTEVYYVLNQDVRSKQQITYDMVTPQETAEGTGPANAISMEEIQRGNVYSKYPLYASDPILRSNSGPATSINAGIPDDWSITSFTINSTDAAGGILGKGDYADLMGVSDEKGGAQYILNNMMILEVTFLNQEYDGNSLNGPVVGEVIHYTVGLPPEYVAFLHDALNDYENIKLVKAPYEVNYTERDLAKLKGSFNYDERTGNLDVFEGSDPAFTEVKRDANGKPIREAEIQEQRDENLENFEQEFQEEEVIEDESSQTETPEVEVPNVDSTETGE